MSDRGRRLLLGILAGGLLLRLILAVVTPGAAFDIESYRLAGVALWQSPLHVYETVNPQADQLFFRWPYPPGYFPWLIGAEWVVRMVDIPHPILVKLPIIVAEMGIALMLGRFSASYLPLERQRIQAAALVSFGPSFFLISAVHGQLDALAILPVVIAFVLWDRMSRTSRSLLVGLLVGAGAALKTVPIVMLGALVPAVRRRTEQVVMVAAALAVPGLLLLPFILTTPHVTMTALRYSGAPGVGGLSVILQPSLASDWMLGRDLDLSPLSELLWQNGSYLVAGVLGVVGLLCLVRKPRPIDAALLIWLALYAFAPAFFFQYLVWGMPFFLLAGRLRWVAVLQAVALVPTLIALNLPWQQAWIMWIYVPLMDAMWMGFVVAFALQARHVLTTSSAVDESVGVTT